MAAQLPVTIFERVCKTLKPVLRPLARQYGRLIEKECRKNGVRFEDIMDDTPAVKSAMKLVPAFEMEKRQRRVHRAIDLDLKHAELTKEQQGTYPLATCGTVSVATRHPSRTNA